MKSKNIFSAAFVVLVSLGIFIYVGSRKQTPVGKEFPWAGVRKDALIQIDMESFQEGAPEKYTLSLKEGVWTLTKPEFYSTLPENSSILVNSFMNLKPKEVIAGVSTEEFNAYGFNAPRMKMTVKFKGHPDTTLIVGAETSVGEDVYVALEELRDSAFIVPSKDMAIFLRGMSALINNKILKESGENVVSLRFRNLKSEDMEFFKTNGFWVQTPSMATNRDWGVRRFLLTAADLSFETENITYRVSPEAASAFGINTVTAPALSFTFADGKTSTVHIGPREENLYPAYVPEMKLLAWIQSGTVHALFTTSARDLDIKKQ